MKVAIITGSARGLGAALVSACESHFDRVIGLSRSGTVSGSGHGSGLKIDLADPQAPMERLLGEAIASEPSRVVLFSNAGMMGEIGPIGRATTAALPEAAAVNLIAPARLVAFLLDRLRGDLGRLVLVNVSSGAAKRPIAGWSTYCATKAAARAFFDCVALEYPEVTVHNVDPGVMDTAMQGQIRAAGEARMPDHAYFNALRERGELQDPAEVAARLVRELVLS